MRRRASTMSTAVQAMIVVGTELDVYFGRRRTVDTPIE
jgi:hypothetical protein